MGILLTDRRSRTGWLLYRKDVGGLTTSWHYVTVYYHLPDLTEDLSIYAHRHEPYVYLAVEFRDAVTAHLANILERHPFHERFDEAAGQRVRWVTLVDP